jgi:carbamoyl-phosphate synthase large subunit
MNCPFPLHVADGCQFDTADRLYFEELSYERVMDIYELEAAAGVVVSFGAQLSQSIALRLENEGGARVLGTSPKDIDRAEDRHKFSQILDSIGVDQPRWKELTSLSAAESFASEVGFPVLVRPSYVLSGAAMSVARSYEELKEKLSLASTVSPDHPVVLTQFIEGASELDVDAVGSQGQLLVHAVSLHASTSLPMLGRLLRSYRWRTQECIPAMPRSYCRQRPSMLTFCLE